MEYTEKQKWMDSKGLPEYCFLFPERYRKRTIGMWLALLLMTVIVVMVLLLLAYMALFWQLGLHAC